MVRSFKQLMIKKGKRKSFKQRVSDKKKKKKKGRSSLDK